MVGNDPERDLMPAHRLGIKTFFVDGESGSSPGFETGRGRLADLRPWLESVNLATLEPSFKSPQGVLAIMESTPAVLGSLSASLTEEQWKHEPTHDDWAMNELVCHLAEKVSGGLQVEHRNADGEVTRTINLTRPWRRVTSLASRTAPPVTCRGRKAQTFAIRP